MAWIKSLVQRTSLVPLPDGQPPPLVVVQRKLLDGDGLGPLAIRRSTEPRYAPRLRMMMTRQLLAGFLGMGTPGHAGKIVAAGRESELVVCQRGK
jgi:hypothetical protein